MGVVDDIIMNKGGGMQEFYKWAGHISFFFDWGKKLGAEKYKHGTDLLAFALNDVISDAIQKRYRTLHCILKATVEFFELCLDWFFKLVERSHVSCLLVFWIIMNKPKQMEEVQ